MNDLGLYQMLNLFIERSYLISFVMKLGDILIKDKLLMAMVLRLTMTSACVCIKGKKRKKENMQSRKSRAEIVLLRLTAQGLQLSLIHTSHPHLCFK